ncbi:hypothetical protein GCM10022225_07350 [Plantactinospora mayteni]|uniref:Uncharacterized protein n=1 Tax=Plantactinospora mayteni TaxID=566021 RepID=A0ABQ4EIG8_9ACTN|nr:hypothetical protein [Plantactinospora mayteni]GIG94518.1 hypothetical protein Pma05_10910 [Plantactinospora mayteni]
MSRTSPGIARPKIVWSAAPGGFDQLGPGQFPCTGASRPQTGQRRSVDPVEDPPRGGVRGDRPEQARLLPQHRQIADGFTTVGQQHRQIDSHPARLMRRPTHPVQPQRLNETPASGSMSKSVKAIR